MARRSGDRELTSALEAALTRELMAAWRQLNQAYFREALTAPTMVLVPSRITLGRWVADHRTMEISRSLVIEQPWGAVVEVLKHEMAHQYVHEVLGEGDQSPHGRAFREACERLGVDARAAGMPAAAGHPDPMDVEGKIVERMARLLALAESPNRHEAEAAMAAAQRLMLRYNLDAVRAQAHRDYGFAHLGDPNGRIGEHERLVAMILGKHFFVQAIWIPVYRPLEGKRGSVLEICGTRANLSMSEYVHTFLHETAERLWRQHREASGIASDRERRTYLAGVMTGFSERLARQDTKSRSEGLVWVKDGDLAGYFGRRHPHVRHVRHAGRQRTDAWVRGREAGRALVLHRPVTAAPVARGRLLGPKS